MTKAGMASAPSATARAPRAGASVNEIESLEMPDGTWAICDHERSWLERPAFLSAPSFSQHLLDPGSPVHTRQLLAAALRAGSAVHSPVRHRFAGHGCSLPRYIYSLAGSYQTTHATPDVMRHAAARLAAGGNAVLARHCRGVADEETGHDQLALKDLEALGIRSAEFVKEVRPRNALALVALFRGFADGENPAAVLGYAYALERFALFTTQKGIEAIEAIVPPGTMATRCLRVHSANGSDTGHVAAAVQVISRSGPSDRIAITRAAFETAACLMSSTDYPGDEKGSKLVSRYMKSSRPAAAAGREERRSFSQP